MLRPIGATPLPTSEMWARSSHHKYLGAELMFALAGRLGKTGGGEGHLGLGRLPCEPKPLKFARFSPISFQSWVLAPLPPTLCIQGCNRPPVQGKVQVLPRHHPAHPEATVPNPAVAP